MEGLRRWMFSNGSINIQSLSSFSEETNYPMVVLDFLLGDQKDYIQVDDSKINHESILLTPNYSWSVDSNLSSLFTGKTIGDIMICSGGLTTGRNEYFVRDIQKDNTIIEEYEFQLYDDYITLDNEIKRAKNNKISIKKAREIKQKQSFGETKVNVFITKIEPKVIELPHTY